MNRLDHWILSGQSVDVLWTEEGRVAEVRGLRTVPVAPPASNTYRCEANGQIRLLVSEKDGRVAVKPARGRRVRYMTSDLFHRTHKALSS